MKVGVATAEPFGYYHTERVRSHARTLHNVTVGVIVPHFDPHAPHHLTQYTPDMIADCNLIVVNSLSPGAWTSSVADLARHSRTPPPLVFSWCAYLNEGRSGDPHANNLSAVTAPSQLALDNARNHLGWAGNSWGETPPEHVVGDPALDTAPPFHLLTRHPKRVAIVTSVSEEIPGGDDLREATDALHATGWDVRVALHPRENPDVWAPYPRAVGETLNEAALASRIVCHPGTAIGKLLATGTPVVGIANSHLVSSVPAPLVAYTSQYNPAFGFGEQFTQFVEGATRLPERNRLNTQRLLNAWLRYAR